MVYHLLEHTSGLPDLHIETLRSERPSYERSLAFALSSEPMWEPGSRYEYVSAPWLLLAETIARLSGTSYDGALRMRLTRPLGMHDTSFDPRRDRGRVVPVHGFRIDNRNRNPVRGRPERRVIAARTTANDEQIRVLCELTNYHQSVSQRARRPPQENTLLAFLPRCLFATVDYENAVLVQPEPRRKLEIADDLPRESGRVRPVRGPVIE